MERKRRGSAARLGWLAGLIAMAHAGAVSASGTCPPPGWNANCLILDGESELSVAPGEAFVICVTGIEGDDCSSVSPTIYAERTLGEPQWGEASGDTDVLHTSTSGYCITVSVACGEEAEEGEVSVTLTIPTTGPAGSIPKTVTFTFTLIPALQ